MDRRRFLKSASAAAAALVGPRAMLGEPASGKPRKPNIIFILADDLGYGDLGCYGQKRIRTPNIDALAAEGMRFTDAYAGSTVCAPSRCCLMTGYHTGHARIRGNGGPNLRGQDVTVAEVLKGAGYATALVGKWGLGEAGSEGVPTRQGFDTFYGYLNQHHAHNYYPTFLWRNEEKVALPNVVPNEDRAGGGCATVRKAYSHDLLMDEALKFVERGAKGDKPFFLYLALTIPHANNEAGARGMEVPDLGPYAKEDWPEPEKGKAAMVSRMDADIGRLMALLKKLGIDGDTLVFFSSDNGPHREGGANPAFFCSSGRLSGFKRSLHDGGIRVPMVARWPGHVRAGAVSDLAWAFWDFLPTAAEIAGAAAGVPKGLDGMSVLPALLGRRQAAHEQLYWEFSEGGFVQAMRMGRWKAIRRGPGAAVQLYDLDTDVGEAKDVAAGHADVVKRIAAALDAARTGPLPAQRTKNRR